MTRVFGELGFGEMGQNDCKRYILSAGVKSFNQRIRRIISQQSKAVKHSTALRSTTNGIKYTQNDVSVITHSS